jgi:hypothetical protein
LLRRGHEDRHCIKSRGGEAHVPDNPKIDHCNGSASTRDFL